MIIEACAYAANHEIDNPYDMMIELERRFAVTHFQAMAAVAYALSMRKKRNA